MWAGRTPSVTQMALEPALDRTLDVAFDPALGLEIERTDDCRALVEAAATRFARALGRPVPRLRFQAEPDQQVRALDLHAAALATVLDGGDVVDAVGALGQVLDH